MTKALYFIGAVLTLLSISFNASAHTGMTHSSNMHLVIHIVTGITVCMALASITFFLIKYLPKVIKQRAQK